MNKLIYVCPIVFLFACGQSHNRQQQSDTEPLSDNIIHIAADSPQSSKIILEKVDSVLYHSNFSTSGSVKAISSQIAEIATPFDGRITKSYVQLGQKIDAGTPIFELSSTEFHDIAKLYFQASQNKQLTELNRKRERDLVQHGVGVQKELEEAEANYESALKEYEGILATLRIFNVNPEQLVMGQGLKICTPIAGEVVQDNMVIGQYIKNDAPPVAIVAELSKVWVAVQVKERYIGLIQPGDEVKIRMEAHPDKITEGSIYHINELLDEDTRSVQVLVACDNAKRELKPGMFADVTFVGAPHQAIVIPSTALFQSEDNNYVYVQVAPEKYTKRSVKAATAQAGKVAIAEGLKVGEIIVADGGFYLEN